MAERNRALGKIIVRVFGHGFSCRGRGSDPCLSAIWNPSERILFARKLVRAPSPRPSIFRRGHGLRSRLFGIARPSRRILQRVLAIGRPLRRSTHLHSPVPVNPCHFALTARTFCSVLALRDVAPILIGELIQVYDALREVFRRTSPLVGLAQGYNSVAG